MKAAKVICTGCRRVIVESGQKCSKCQQRGHRGTSKNRPGLSFYSSSAWRKLRLQKLSDSPLCECDDCMASGAVTPADVVDHIKTVCDHPELSLEYSNLRSMATAHHNSHTAKTRKDR
jgi:5-methylcytosine-specific restriction protein A